MLMYQKNMLDRYYKVMAYINVIMTSKITFATVCSICDDVKFCDGPGILHIESHSHVLTARELLC